MQYRDQLPSRSHKSNKSKKLEYLRKLAIIVLITLIGGFLCLFSIVSRYSGSQSIDYFYNNPILLDFIEVLVPPTLTFKQDGSTIHNKEGIFIDEQHSEGNASYVVSPDARIELEFVGDKVEWYGYRAASYGKVDVYIDNKFQQRIDLYNGPVLYQTKLYESVQLKEGTHVISLKSSFDKNDQSVGIASNLDYFKVYQNNNSKIYENSSSSITYINPNRYYYYQYVGRKLIHVAIYSIFTLLLLGLTTLLRKGKRWIIASLVIVFSVACVDEARQVYLDGRHPSVQDIIVDTVGMIIALTIYVLLRWCYYSIYKKESRSY